MILLPYDERILDNLAIRMVKKYYDLTTQSLSLFLFFFGLTLKSANYLFLPFQIRHNQFKHRL